MSKAWEQQPRETGKAYAAFCVYRDMGNERSLDKAYRESKGHQRGINSPRASRTWRQWSMIQQWVDRAAAYDDYLEALARAEHEALWTERQRELAEGDWQDGQQLRDLVKGLLAELPKFIRRSENIVTGPDGEQVKVITVKLNTTITQLATALKAASELQRLAAGEPNQRIDIEDDRILVVLDV